MIQHGRARRLACLALLPLALGITAAAAPRGAVAGGSSFTTAPKNIDQIDSNKPVKAGDWISIGWVIDDHNGNNAAMDIYLENGKALIAWTCSAGSSTAAGSYSVPIPVGPLHYPKAYTANGGWFPTNQWADPSTYELAVQRPGSWCGGASAYVVNNGETYSGSVASSSSTSDLFHVQLHTAIPDAVGHGNIDCASTSQNPSPGVGACKFNQNGDVDNLTPALYSAPAATPAPTPTASPSASPAPTPQPSPSPSPASTSTPTPGSSPDPSSATGGGSSPDAASGVMVGLNVIGATGGSGRRSAGAAAAPSASAKSTATVAGQESAIPVSGVEAIQAAPTALTPALQPLRVISGAASAASGWLAAHLPLRWFALLAALDVLLSIGIIVRRRRARKTAIAMNGNQRGIGS